MSRYPQENSLLGRCAICGRFLNIAKAAASFAPTDSWRLEPDETVEFYCDPCGEKIGLNPPTKQEER